MRTIKVYGKLAELIGQRTFRASVSSVAEAISFLLANFPHIETHMIDQQYRVKAGKNIIDASELSYPVGSSETISVIPVYCGAGAVGRIIIGALLIGAAFFLLPGVAILGVAVAPMVFSIGLALVLGGIAQLLQPPTPTDDREKDPGESYSFSGIQNNSRQGLPIAIIYGETVTGSITISAGVTIA